VAAPRNTYVLTLVPRTYLRIIIIIIILDKAREIPNELQSIIIINAARNSVRELAVSNASVL